MQNKCIVLWENNREYAVLLGIFLVAFCLRLYFLMTYPYPLMLHEQDGIAYMQIARDLLHFKPLQTTFMPPFYPVVISVFSFLPVNFELAARLASITMDALVVVPLYGLGKGLFNRLAAVSACWLWAFFPVGLYGSTSPMAFSTYLFFLLAGTYLLYRVLYEERNALWNFAAGACFSFAYLTRPEGIVAAGCGLIFCGLHLLKKDGINRKNIRSSVLYLAGFLLFAAPYWIFLHNHLGYWTFTGKTAVAIKGVDGSLLLKGGSVGEKGASGLALWLDKFGGLTGGLRFALDNAKGFMATLRSDFPLWMEIPAAAGCCLFVNGKSYRSRVFLLIPVLATVPVYIANLPKTPGYIYPLFPVFFLAFSWSLDRSAYLVRKLIDKSTLSIPFISYQVLFCACAFIVLVFYGDDSVRKTSAVLRSPELMYQAELSTKIFKESGEFVKGASNPADLVMTRWGLICYFADRPYITLPKGTVADVIEYGRKAGVKFFVIDTISVETRRQELRELLNPLYGKEIDARYGIQAIRANGYNDLGGYVVYQYLPQ